MHIIIKQAELEAAVRQYVSGLGITAPINSVSFTAKRGDDGIIAEVDVGASQASSASAEATSPVALVEGGTETISADSGFSSNTSLTEEGDSDVSEKSSIFGG